MLIVGTSEVFRRLFRDAEAGRNELGGFGGPERKRIGVFFWDALISTTSWTKHKRLLLYYFAGEYDNCKLYVPI